MWVDMLKRASKLVIEPFYKGHDAAGDAEDFARCDGREFLVILPLLGVLDNNNLLTGLENLKKFAELLVGPARLLASSLACWIYIDVQLPLLLVHMASSSGSQIKASRYERQKNTNPLVVVDRYVEQPLQCSDVLELVRVLASTLFDNRPQMLEDAFGCVLDGLAARTHGDEAIISCVLDDVGAELGNLGLLLLLGCRRDLLFLAHELVFVLPVQIDVFLVVAVVLLDLLADGVEATGVDGVHLLGRDLLLLVCLEDDGLEVGDGLDVQLGHLAVILLDQGGHLAVELVELCIDG